MWHMSFPCGTTLMLVPTYFTRYLDLDFDFDLRLQKNLTLTIILNQRRKDPYIIYCIPYGKTFPLVQKN